MPITIKFRIGIDDRITTFLDAGRVGEAEGVVAVALHARTAAQLYDGSARWEAIAELKRAVRVPVLGNGDIWEAEDALRMMRQTGCDGVVVGRGCLGQTLAVSRSRRRVRRARARESAVARRRRRDHARARGAPAQAGSAKGRRFAPFAGTRAGTRRAFAAAPRRASGSCKSSTLGELDEALAALDPNEPFPPSAMRVPRGKASGTQAVSLPHGYLDDRDDATPPEEAAEDGLSGG